MVVLVGGGVSYERGTPVWTRETRPDITCTDRSRAGREQLEDFSKVDILSAWYESTLSQVNRYVLSTSE